MSTPIECTWRVELLLSGVWTNVRADVIAAEPIRWKRGTSANGPQDHMAQPGIFEFSLRNDAGNSGHLQGYYAPNHVNCRTGFGYGIGVRVIATFSATDYTRWTGRLRTIDPDPGTYRSQRTHCTAQDTIADLADTDVRAISPQVNQTEDALISAVLAALPSQVQPTATAFDPGLDVVPYALYNIGGGVRALQAISDAVVSAFGWCYPKGNGTLVYENRHTRVLKTSVFTLNIDTSGDALAVPSSLDGVYNRIRVTYHPQAVDPAATTVLYASPAPSSVAPGQSVTVWGTYVDPTNTLKLIGGTSVVDGVLGSSDYSANTLADGSGADLRGAVTVTATGFAADVRFVITNTGTQTAFVTPRVRGKGIYDNAPITVESYTAKAYGDRPLDVDLPFQADGLIAQDLADYLNALYNGFQSIDSAAIKANRSAALMVQALTREIGDVVTVVETATGTSALAALQGIEETVTGGVWLLTTWFLTPQITSQSFLFDDATLGVLDVDVWGYA